ncbi:MAG: trigger factor [Deltaproteobacteria bacterium]|nr:trigger factor [Deltaproteobacteria bacterium]
MQVTVSRISAIEVSVQVLLPKGRVTTALDRAYGELNKRARVHGFRPGKVPRPVLKQIFGARVAEDVFRSLVNETLPEALRDKGLDPVTSPKVEPDGALSEAQDFSYTARVEVRPDVSNVDLSGLTLTRTVYQLTDHDVDEALALRREQNATSRVPEPARPAQAGDTVTVDYDLLVDGVDRPEFRSRGRTLEVGENGLLKDLNRGIIGMSVGETRELPVTFPEGFRQAELAGKSAVFRLTVNELREKVLPALDDEFAKDCGEDTLEALRLRLRGELEKSFGERSEMALRDAAVEALVKANPIHVPPSMVEQIAGQLRQEFIQSYTKRGIALPPDLDAELRSEAEGRVRAGLLLGELARGSGITVTEEELTAELEKMAEETGRAIQRLRVEYRDPKKRELLMAGVLEDKVLKVLLSKATITDEARPTHDHTHGHGDGHGTDHDHEAATAAAGETPAAPEASQENP